MPQPELEDDTVKFENQAEVENGVGKVAEKKYDVYGSEGETVRTIFPERAEGFDGDFPESLKVSWQGTRRVWELRFSYQENGASVPVYESDGFSYP